MKMSVIVLSVVVALFGAGSAVLRFIAEGNKLTRDDIEVYSNECVFPANPAYAQGLVAALLLLMAQITASVVGGCCGCCRPRGAGFSGSKPVTKSKRAIGAALCVLSWIMALIAERFILQVAAGNIPMTRETSQGRGCHPVKDGVFMTGAILSIVATVFGIISYIMLYAAAAAGANTTTTMGAAARPSSAGETKYDGFAIGYPVAAQQHAQAV